MAAEFQPAGDRLTGKVKIVEFASSGTCCGCHLKTAAG